jgi:RNAse (barnase) inhibitor barstar
MSLHLNLDDESIELPVQIVWADSNAQNRRYRAGARFIRLTEKNLHSLQQKLPKSRVV